MFMRLLHNSIRKKFALLFLLSALPGILFVSFTSISYRNSAIDEAKQDLVGFANQLADAQERTTFNTKLNLENLAKIPEVRQGNALACEKLFATMLKVNPLYGALNLVDLHGNTVASSGPLAAANFGQSKQFKDALLSKAFATGEYNFGLATTQPTMTFACPVFGEMGEVAGVLLSSVLLESYGRQFDLRRFPPDSFVTVCDQNGLRLFRYPALDTAPLGAEIHPALLEAARAAPEGVTERAGDNGANVIAFKQLRLSPDAPPYMYIFAGTPKASLYALAQQGMLRDIAILLATIGVTLTFGWFLGGKAVVRKLEELAENSFRIGVGDYSAHVEVDSNIQEVDTVAQSFNAMVGILQQQKTYRQDIERVVALQAERFQNMSELSQELLYSCLDRNGEFLMDWLSGAELPLTGYSRIELMDMGNLRNLVVEEDKHLYYKHVADLQPGMKGDCALRLRKKDGDILWVRTITQCIAPLESPYRRRIYSVLCDLTKQQLTEAPQPQGGKGTERGA